MPCSAPHEPRLRHTHTHARAPCVACCSRLDSDLYDEEFPNTTLQIRDWWREPLAHMSQGLEFLYYEKLDVSRQLPSD